VDTEGRSKTFRAKVYDYRDPYWWVEYPEGDWEKLTKGRGGKGHRRRGRTITFRLSATVTA